MTEDALLRNGIAQRPLAMRKTSFIVSACALCLFAFSVLANAQTTYSLGFDRNDYPGDDLLPALHKTFAWTGYWLNNPPGANENSWTGKREIVKAAGFGFAVLYNGRLYKELKGKNPAEVGARDGKDAAARANHEGFRAQTILFIDQEEGGRMLPEQRAYLHAWADAVTNAGYRPGVYCSAVPFKEDSGETLVTAADIRNNSQDRKIAFWVYNDSCAPSHGCVFPKNPPSPAKSGVAFADIWQFAQSPRRNESKGCPKNYNKDGNCYAPALPAGSKAHVDVNTATTPDPSSGR